MLSSLTANVWLTASPLQLWLKHPCCCRFHASVCLHILCSVHLTSFPPHPLTIICLDSVGRSVAYNTGKTRFIHSYYLSMLSCQTTSSSTPVKIDQMFIFVTADAVSLVALFPSMDSRSSFHDRRRRFSLPRNKCEIQCPKTQKIKEHKPHPCKWLCLIFTYRRRKT